MIPKIIHFVWLGGGDYTPSVKRCIESWQKYLPDYEIKCWSEKNFDLNSIPWTKEAIEKKKWSLASDYIRHYALYTEGGIYFDTDIEVYKSFDDFLEYSFFSSIEYHPNLYLKEGINQIDENFLPKNVSIGVAGLGILAAAFGAEKGNPFIKDCLDFFGQRHFIKEDGSLFEDLINPAVMPLLLTKYGFVYKNEEQLLQNNMKIFDASVLAGDPSTRTDNSYSMHWCDSSWRSDLSLKSRIMRYLKTHFPNYFRK